MYVTVKRQRNGKLRPYWYGEFTDSDGRRKIINVGKWKGTPSPYLLETGDSKIGDTEFERSRQEARNSLSQFVEEARRKGRAEHLIERLIESKTGTAVTYVKITDLYERWLSLRREKKISEKYRINCKAVFARFVSFIEKQNPKAEFLYQVSPVDISAFNSQISEQLSSKTCRDYLRLLQSTFGKLLPPGSSNPFLDSKVNTTGSANISDDAIHRKPFSSQELRKILDAARDDDFLYPIITAAACSGMRRGDVCELKWSDVDLEAEMIVVKTSKTKKVVEIPIFAPLMEVLKKRIGNRSPFVFPEAELMLNGRINPAYKDNDYKGKTADEKRAAKYLTLPNPDGLTWRFKKLVTQALCDKPERPKEEIQAEGVNAIMENFPKDARRDRMLRVFQRYCDGASTNILAKELNVSKGTISNDLHAVQDLMTEPFIRVRVASKIRNATQEKRGDGKRAASIRDWHALRTTWVTLALSAGVPIELVRRVTGHATTEIVLKHYFKPNRDQFKALLNAKMPDVFTGGPQIPALTEDDLSTLADKIVAGRATEAEREKFKKLAAKV